MFTTMKPRVPSSASERRHVGLRTAALAVYPRLSTTVGCIQDCLPHLAVSKTVYHLWLYPRLSTTVGCIQDCLPPLAVSKIVCHLWLYPMRSSIFGSEEVKRFPVQKANSSSGCIQDESTTFGCIQDVPTTFGCIQDVPMTFGCIQELKGCTGQRAKSS